MEGFDIAKARKEKGKPIVSQDKLAKALGLTSRITLADIERGAVAVSDPFVYKAMRAIEDIRDRS